MTAENDYRPDPADRWLKDRTEPVRIGLRTEWLYSKPDRFPACACCPGRHAFSRGGHVVSSDVPSAYTNQHDVVSHLWRAIAAFGDDADLVIEVRRAEVTTPPDEEPTEVWECGPHTNAWNGHDARCRRVVTPPGEQP